MIDRSADVKECALPKNLAALKKYTISVVNPSLKTLAFTDPKNRCDILESVLQNIFHVSTVLKLKLFKCYESKRCSLA